MRADRIIVAIGVAVAWAAAPWAQTYTVNTISPQITYGTVAAGGVGPTVFSQANNVLTVESGSGVKIKGTTRRTTVTIRCVGSGSPNSCGTAGNNVARVFVVAGPAVGRAGPFSNFTATSGTGTVAGTTNGSSLDFTLSGFTTTGNKTFLLDTKMPVAGDDAGGTTGDLSPTFSVYVAKNPTVPTTGLSNSALVTVRRAIKITKDSDLRFGALVKQSSGTSAQVLINNTTGVRTQTGNVNLIPVPTQPSGRAQFTITGEPSSTFAITYSPTGNIPMTSGANTLSVTTSKTNTGNTTMPATGTLVMGVGGTITITSTTARGNYNGNLIVTVTYN